MCFLTIKRVSSFLLAAIILLSGVLASAAETDTGTIDGVVTDAVVGRATVVITTGSISHSFETNDNGEFHVTVPAGIARISVESPGFKVARLNRVRVASGESRSLKIVLTVLPVKYGKCKKGPCIWL